MVLTGEKRESEQGVLSDCQDRGSSFSYCIIENSTNNISKFRKFASIGRGLVAALLMVASQTAATSAITASSEGSISLPGDSLLTLLSHKT